MAPSYKLTYFKSRGIAEPTRYLLAYLGQDFKEIRLDSDAWRSMKSNTPFGKLPILEIDGKVVHQSLAINRYLARKAGLLGKNDWEMLKIDMIVETLSDLMALMRAYHQEPDESVKARKYRELEEIFPFYYARLEEHVRRNNNYFVNGTLSLADIQFVGLQDMVRYTLKRDLVNNYQHLKNLTNKVRSIPSIRAYSEKRPASEYYN
uniref:glutathione transferase n=1 Tax=Bemisia tabaci TaxID=7038 RepID=A0A6C0M9S3_BEMTA|nr:glutathione S-transferase S6 [Bemisia tabaci]